MSLTKNIRGARGSSRCTASPILDVSSELSPRAIGMKPSDTRSLSGHSTDEEFDDEWESIVGIRCGRGQQNKKRRQAEDRAQQSVVRGGTDYEGSGRRTASADGGQH